MPTFIDGVMCIVNLKVLIQGKYLNESIESTVNKEMVTGGLITLGKSFI